MCDPLSPQIYPPPFSNNYMRPSQNVPFPLRIYPPFSTNVHVRPSQNIPLPPSQNTLLPFQQLNATFLESTPLPTTIILCDAPRIYLSLPGYTPPPFNNYIWPSQNIPLPPPQNIPTFQQLYYYTTLPESIPPSISPRIYPPPFQQLYATLTEITPPSENTPPFFRQLYTPFPLRLYPSSPFYNYMWYFKNIALSHWICHLF